MVIFQVGPWLPHEGNFRHDAHALLAIKKHLSVLFMNIPVFLLVPLSVGKSPEKHRQTSV